MRSYAGRILLIVAILGLTIGSSVAQERVPI